MTTYQVSCDSPDFVEIVRRNLEILHDRIRRTGRDVGSVKVLAMTKGFGRDAVEAAALNSLDAVGENYVDELCEKRRSVVASVRWHFVGRLQSNKILRVGDCADVVETVSRVSEIERLAKGKIKDIFVQIDFSGAEHRNGAAEGQVALLVERARECGLRPRGLMTIAPLNANPQPIFARTRRLVDRLGLEECSMGMSDDLEIALGEGATQIRVGRALFGPRPPRATLA